MSYNRAKYLRASDVGRVGHGAMLPDVFGDGLDVNWRC